MHLSTHLSIPVIFKYLCLIDKSKLYLINKMSGTDGSFGGTINNFVPPDELKSTAIIVVLDVSENKCMNLGWTNGRKQGV